MNSYVSIFKNSKIEALERYKAGERGSPGTVKHGRFSLDGLEFMAMDGHSDSPFSLHSRRLALRELRDAGGDRRALGTAF